MNIGNRKNQHSFAQIPDVNVGRSVFDRSYNVKDTFDFDYLVPFLVDEILPGDTYNVRLSSFARLATQLVPIMDNMYIDFFFFFVPNRLVWNNWEKFNGAQTNPGDSTDFVIPTITAPAVTGFTVGSLYDKMGIPTGVPGLQVNALPMRGHNLIHNDWFRDQNLQNSLVVDKDDGPDTYTDYVLNKRGKRHDYFTSALPWAQKGDPVSLPLGTSAPVVTSGDPIQVYSQSGPPGGNMLWNNSLGLTAAGTQSPGNVMFWDPGLVADLSDATAATINQLREAMQIQSMFELDARGGTRYVEILKAHFGVISPDFRLQRPEYLGGGSTRINTHPTPNTTGTEDSPQGTLAAWATAGTSARDGIGFTKSFVEHGYIFGYACARADLTYQQGLNRMWSRRTRFDFFWPKLQQLGEQAILNKEIYAQGSANPTADADPFGYQERYAEYRYKPSEIHGQFRSTYATPLDMWHLAEEFGSLPTLSAAFIVQNTPIERAIAVDTEPDLLFDAFIEMRTARPMMTYSVPASFGRF